MGKLGIGDDTTVVVYDTDGGLWAARVWWALRYYGHEDAKILNGGLQAWVQAGKSLQIETPAVMPTIFNAEIQPQWMATIDEVKKAVEDPQIVIVDALTRPNYTGDLIQYERPGHIATALSLPAPDTLDPVMRTILLPGDLSRMFARLGLDPEKRVIAYCGGGIYGAHTVFVLYLMGFNRVGLYDGSLMEWTSNSSNPMEVEP
jgi:thiosulfate/3-mercaptopyruvate sulfurtransferase